MQQATSQLLLSLITCDQVLWTELNITTSTAIVRRGHSMARDVALRRAPADMAVSAPPFSATAHLVMTATLAGYPT